jgi:DNA-binding protein HU-beta
MNKAELALSLHEKVGISKAQAEKTLDELTKIITDKLAAGEEVVLAGFGAFSSRKRKGRVGVNPRNVKEAINIPSVTVAKFKPGKNLKEVLKGKNHAPVAPAASSSAKATEDKPAAPVAPQA